MTDELRAAWTGAVAGFLGATVAAAASMVVAFHVADSQAGQERANSVREQRQQVYSLALKHEQALEDLEKPCGDRTKLHEALQALEDDAPMVEVTATADTYFDFGLQNLLGTHVAIVAECDKHQSTDTDLKKLEQNRKDLVLKMRGDLQN